MDFLEIYFLIGCFSVFLMCKPFLILAALILVDYLSIGLEMVSLELRLFWRLIRYLNFGLVHIFHDIVSYEILRLGIGHVLNFWKLLWRVAHIDLKTFSINLLCSIFNCLNFYSISIIFVLFCQYIDSIGIDIDIEINSDCCLLQVDELHDFIIKLFV